MTSHRGLPPPRPPPRKLSLLTLLLAADLNIAAYSAPTGYGAYSLDPTLGVNIHLNNATANFSTTLGGYSNTAAGAYSVALGGLEAMAAGE
jgi:hypothetical protein